MDYMIINDFNTSTLAGCVVTDFGKVEAAQPRGEVANLHGVNGSYRVLDGSFKSYERNFTLQSNDNVLEFSYQLGSIFYADFVTANFEPFGNHAWKLEIKLTMQPFRYQKGVAPVVLTAAGTVNNPGTIFSEPIVEIEGDGDVSLTIGHKTMYLAIKTKAVIDCRQGNQNIYNATGAVQNTFRKRGGFFEIPTGKVGVSYTGSVRKITIKGNWRYKV